MAAGTPGRFYKQQLTLATPQEWADLLPRSRLEEVAGQQPDDVWKSNKEEFLEELLAMLEGSVENSET